MNGIREPSAREERGIAERSTHLKNLLDAARAAGLSGYAAYLWDTSRPAEPCIVVEDVHIHCETSDQPFYVIGRNSPKYVSVTQIEDALRIIREFGEPRAPTR